MLVPNCPGAKLSGAKLSVFIMLVPNCPGAKLSGAKLSGCKIVRVPNCPTTILSGMLGGACEGQQIIQIHMAIFYFDRRKFF